MNFYCYLSRIHHQRKHVDINLQTLSNTDEEMKEGDDEENEKEKKHESMEDICSGL